MINLSWSRVTPTAGPGAGPTVEARPSPGLMHVNLGGYHIRDIDFVAAFDIDKNKVGKDLSEAIYTTPNNTYVFQQVSNLGVTVERGMTHDGLGKYLSQIIEKAPGPTADIVSILKEREVDVMVSYLPVGSEEATKWYVEQALKAGVAFYGPPVDPQNPLLKMENVVTLPHIGSATEATRQAMVDLAVDNLLAVLQGKPPLTPVNPEALGKRNKRP